MVTPSPVVRVKSWVALPMSELDPVDPVDPVDPADPAAAGINGQAMSATPPEPIAPLSTPDAGASADGWEAAPDTWGRSDCPTVVDGRVPPEVRPT